MPFEPRSVESHSMQDGVIAAVLHMAEVSAPGTRELVVEFDAASEACRAHAVAVGGPLAEAFEGGLSPAALRRLARVCAFRRDPLHLLQRSVKRLHADADEIEQFGALVLRAAKAAACAERWSGRLFRWLTYPQRIAIAEIRRALIEAGPIQPRRHRGLLLAFDVVRARARPRPA